MSNPKAECEALMNEALPFAEKMLQEHGEFFPYGNALNNKGEVVLVAGYDGREQPPSSDLIKLINQGFVSGAKSGQYKATALVYDVRIKVGASDEKTDAIAVSLNHKDNYSVVVVFPYTLKDGKLTFGELMAEEGEYDVFTTK